MLSLGADRKTQFAPHAPPEKTAALAVMEEFGFGDIGMIKSLSSLPGVALTGETCGAVLGGLITLGTYFGSDDLLDYKSNALAYAQSRKFIFRFEKEVGTTKCRHRFIKT
jgi:hypothetical protein